MQAFMVSVVGQRFVSFHCLALTNFLYRDIVKTGGILQVFTYAGISYKLLPPNMAGGHKLDHLFALIICSDYYYPI